MDGDGCSWAFGNMSAYTMGYDTTSAHVAFAKFCFLWVQYINNCKRITTTLEKQFFHIRKS